MKSTVILALALGLCFAFVASAQEPDDAPFIRAKEFLASLKEYDAALEGTFWYGVHMGGKKNIGWIKIMVGRAPEGSGACYAVDLEVTMSAMGETMSGTMNNLCGPDFALLSRTGKRREGDLVKTETITSNEGRWRCEREQKRSRFKIISAAGAGADDPVGVWVDRKGMEKAFSIDPGTPVTVLSRGDGPSGPLARIRSPEGREGWVPAACCMEAIKSSRGVYTFDTEERNHFELATGWALCRSFELSGKYGYYGIKWPEPRNAEAEEKKLDDSALKTFHVSVAGPSEFEHRGEKVKVHLVTVNRSDGEEDMVFAVTPDRRVLQFWPKGAPAKFILGTEAQAKRDLEVKEPEGAAPVKQAVRVYFEVLAKVRDVDELDDVVDWESVRQELALTKPAFETLSAEEAAKAMKDEFRNLRAPLTAKQVAAIFDMVRVEIEGDDARLYFPGRDHDPVLLKKLDGKWVMVKLPM